MEILLGGTNLLSNGDRDELTPCENSMAQINCPSFSKEENRLDNEGENAKNKNAAKWYICYCLYYIIYYYIIIFYVI